MFSVYSFRRSKNRKCFVFSCVYGKSLLEVQQLLLVVVQRFGKCSKNRSLFSVARCCQLKIVCHMFWNEICCAVDGGATECRSSFWFEFRKILAILGIFMMFQVSVIFLSVTIADESRNRFTSSSWNGWNVRNNRLRKFYRSFLRSSRDHVLLGFIVMSSCWGWTSDGPKMMKNVRKYLLFNNQLVVSLLNDTQISFTL